MDSIQVAHQALRDFVKKPVKKKQRGNQRRDATFLSNDL
jgi:hypothetical protein